MAIYSKETHPLLSRLKGTQVIEDSSILQRREKKQRCAVCNRPTEYGYKLRKVFRYICSHQCDRDFFTCGSVQREEVNCMVSPKAIKKTGGWKKRGVSTWIKREAPTS